MLIHVNENMRLQCPGESCPTCRYNRGENVNNPNIQRVNGSWQIIFWPDPKDSWIKKD